ncbi:hypothetical protein [Ottowia cancrivicina]|uniref:Uncharacterized protein n=1 Tax=Ottowia cancrivicina TaxID=3040346 RepID=A0AAW6RLM7_9BURK|nr:hypothetical protein [Ottowia sp. 10c7w1]MDG9700445.1 hypothetical protein [Ottowia sp. 10c7w1]
MTAIAASIFTPQINRPCLLVLFSPCALNHLSHLPGSLKKRSKFEGVEMPLGAVSSRTSCYEERSKKQLPRRPRKSGMTSSKKAARGGL